METLLSAKEDTYIVQIRKFYDLQQMPTIFLKYFSKALNLQESKLLAATFLIN